MLTLAGVNCEKLKTVNKNEIKDKTCLDDFFWFEDKIDNSIKDILKYARFKALEQYADYPVTVTIMKRGQTAKIENVSYNEFVRELERTSREEETEKKFVVGNQIIDESIVSFLNLYDAITEKLAKKWLKEVIESKEYLECDIYMSKLIEEYNKLTGYKDKKLERILSNNDDFLKNTLYTSSTLKRVLDPTLQFDINSLFKDENITETPYDINEIKQGPKI